MKTFDSGPSDAKSRRPRDQESGFQGALAYWRSRWRQAVAQDGFGKPSRIGQAILTATWILVFFGLWKLLDSVFTLHWFFSAMAAVVLASILVRIIRRMLWSSSE